MDSRIEIDKKYKGKPDFLTMMQAVPGLQFENPHNPFVHFYNTNKLIENPNLPVCNLNEVITPALPDQSADRIKDEFNKDIKKGKSCFEESAMRGETIPSGNFLLGERNQKAEIHGPSTKPIARNLTLRAGDNSHIVKTINQNESYFVSNGKHVVNVPAGHYIFAKSGTKPLILGQGCHVIIDSKFSLIDTFEKSLVNQSDSYIHHETIHILIVPMSKYAKVTIDNVPFILPGQKEPYVFNSSNFKFTHKDSANAILFHDQTEQYIHHGYNHIIRVPVGKVARILMNGQDPWFLQGRPEPYIIMDPAFRLVFRNNEDFLFDQSEQYLENGNKRCLRIPQGKYAKAWFLNTPLILLPQAFPYYSDDPNFRVQKQNEQFLFDQTDSYISHGNLHWLRVPAGKLAVVQLRTMTMFLENGEYNFDDPSFQLVAKDGHNPFFNATEKLIQHNNMKRIIPCTGEVAIATDSGKRVVLHPKDDGTPYLITSPNYEVKGFMDTALQTLEFPSKHAREKRKLENKNLSDELASLELFRTGDSVDVGVRLVVAFEIKDVEAALNKFKTPEGILKYIEETAVADMRSAIQLCNSQQFTNSNRTQSDKEATDSSHESKKITYQGVVEDKLREDLGKFGIVFNRLNIEESKILDPHIQKALAEVSISSATANAQESTMHQKYRIAQCAAQQEAEQKRIAQEQQNQTLVLNAEAQLKAAELENKAKLIQAQTKKEVAQLEAEANQLTVELGAEAEAKKIKVIAEATAEATQKTMSVEGQVLTDNPALKEVRIASLVAEAIGKSNMTVTPNQYASMLPGSFGFFGGNASAQPTNAEPKEVSDISLKSRHRGQG